MTKKKIIIILVCFLIFVSIVLGIYFLFGGQIGSFQINSDTVDNDDENSNLGNIVPAGKYAQGKNKTYEKKINLAQNNFAVPFPEYRIEYRFEFAGDDGDNIIYSIDPNDEQNKKGNLKIKSAINGQIFYPVAGNGPYFRKDDNHLLKPKEAKNLVTSSLIRHQMIQKDNIKALILNYQDTFKKSDGSTIERRRNLRITIKGKSLRVRVSSPTINQEMIEANYNYSGWQLGKPAETNNLRHVLIPYMTNNPVDLINNKIYSSAFIDLSQSHGTKIIAENDNSKRVSTIYEPNADNKVSNLREIFWVTVSSKIDDTFSIPNNPQSQYRSDLSKRLIWSTWKEGDFLKGPDGNGLTVPINIAGQSFNSIKFNNDKVWLEVLKKYGLENLLVIENNWRNSPSAKTVPEHLPIPQRYGGEEEYKKLTSEAKKLGYLFLQHELWSYINPRYVDPNSADYKKEYSQYLVYNQNNNPKTKKTFNVKEDEYIVSPDKYKNMAEKQVNLLKQLGANGAFMDTISAYIPHKIGQINFNTSTDNKARNIKESIKYTKEFYNYLKSAYQGPIFGEGGKNYLRYDTYYAGFIDGVEREHEYHKNGYIIPDFELKYIKPRMVNFGMGWRLRWLCQGGDNDNIAGREEDELENLSQTNCTIDFDTFDYDRYRAQTISFGHSFLLPNIYNLTSTDKNLQKLLSRMIKEYYLGNELQNQYLKSEVKKIVYFNQDGPIGELSEVVIDNPKYDFSKAMIKIEYKNGLTIFTNNDQNNNWEIKLNEKYNLPPNGFLAINPKLKGWNGNGPFIAYTKLDAGKIVDFVSSENYIFMDARGTEKEIQGLKTTNIKAIKKDGTEINCDITPKCTVK